MEPLRHVARKNTGKLHVISRGGFSEPAIKMTAAKAVVSHFISKEEDQLINLKKAMTSMSDNDIPVNVDSFIERAGELPDLAHLNMAGIAAAMAFLDNHDNEVTVKNFTPSNVALYTKHFRSTRTNSSLVAVGLLKDIDYLKRVRNTYPRNQS